MDIMELLAQARPGSLDSRPGVGRRASDLARAIAAPRDGMTAQPGARRRPGVRRASPPARVIVLGFSVAALASIAGVVVALMATGMPTPHPQPAAARAGTAAATPGKLKNAILTAFDGAAGDVLYTEITETYPGEMSKYNDVSQNWAYPIQPQAGQQAFVHTVLVPSNPDDKSDTEWIYTEPGAGAAPRTKTEIIYVQYGNRTWSDETTNSLTIQTPAAALQELRDSIATGDFTVAGKTELNGQAVLELTAHFNVGGNESEQTLWVDPATYLPVRTLSGGDGTEVQVDYEFLPPTPANMAALKAIIPPGFTQTPTAQK